MTVVYAYYGASCANGHLRKDVEYRSIDWVARQCNGKNWCRAKVTNENLDIDPYRGCPKDFFVVAKCSNGKFIGGAVKAVGGEGQRFVMHC